MNAGIVTDSTCDLPAEILSRYGIEVVPLTVNFADGSYQDGVDIKSGEFFTKLNSSGELPATSQPSVGLFLDKYRELAGRYDTIISLHISGKLSGTIKSARMAAERVETRIIPFDSRSTTLGLGYLVILAARLLENGFEIEEIISILEKAREKTNIYFSVNDLKYLEKGGRIGKAQAFLGSVLNFNPILSLKGSAGEILPLEKVRGNKKTRQKMLSLLAGELEGGEKVRIGLLNGLPDKMSKKFIGKAEELLNNQAEDKEIKVIKGYISPVLGSHVGPSVYGFAAVKGEFLPHGE